MADNCSIYTIGDYLKGKVRNITIPDVSIISICADASASTNSDIMADSQFSNLTVKQKEVTTAWLYVWIAGSPTQTGSNTEEDADWKHTEGGERMSANVLKQYLSMANDIFEKYGLPIVGDESWGFVGRGFRNPRKRI